METGMVVTVHGRGNAWPVPLGEEHPFYDRRDPGDLSNAAFSVAATTGGRVVADVLVDAGHGTIQSLLSGPNRIPDCICLTHGHMDHTLSVDWIVQSHWKKYRKERKYPVYCSVPVYRELIRSYPQLEEMLEFMELGPGVTRELEPAPPFRVTAFPAYHGSSAWGASMLLFEGMGRRVLFTGDILTPLLRSEDYERIGSVDLMVTDTNNRFPWPRTNHWSLAGHPDRPMVRSDALAGFIRELSWEALLAPHLGEHTAGQEPSYYAAVIRGRRVEEQPFTILEFLGRVRPKKLMLVHYSGSEDQRYYNAPLLDAAGLREWSSATLQGNGIRTELLIPRSGEVIPL